MFIDASKRSDMMRERTKYVADYNQQLANYVAEESAYKKDAETYTSRVAKSVRKALSPEIKKFDNINLTVKRNTDSYVGVTGFYVDISYTSTKNNDPTYLPSGPSRTRGEARGFNWSIEIYLKITHTDKETGEITIEALKNPRIYAEFLESDDYNIMEATRKLFLKIDKLDWNQILNEANANTPKRDSYGKTTNPGKLNTYHYDSHIDTYDIERTMGTDTWVKVHVNREESYNSWSDNARNAGVHGNGWMKLNSMTNTYYFFNWINSHGRKAHGYVGEIDPTYSKFDMDMALSEEHKLRKAYI